MTNSEKFLETVVQTISDRGQSYGSPSELFDDVAKRWSLTLGADISPAQVVMCMIDLKLARLNSNPGHEDSIIDIAGYAFILNEIARRFEDASH